MKAESGTFPREVTSSASGFVHIAGLAAWLLAGCANVTAVEPAPVSTIVSAPLRPTPLVPPSNRPSPAPPELLERRTPVIVAGTGIFANTSGAARASAGVQDLAGDRITVNFVEADIKDVVKSLLGTTLRQPYTIDPRVQGTLTLQTSEAVLRQDALLMLESALRANGVALVHNETGYAVVPLADAPSQSGAVRFRGVGVGFGIHVIPLSHISAAEMATIIQPFLPADRILKADASRPLLLFAGTPQETALVEQLVGTFDVDWIKGMSFGMFPLESAKPSDLAKELEAMAGASRGSSGSPAGGAGGEREAAAGPLQGLMRFVPIDRLNALMVITQHPQYLTAVRKWIQILDKAKNTDTPRLFVYYPQNSRAEALASTLSEIFSSGRGRGGPDFNVAPGQNGLELFSPQDDGSGGGYRGGGGGFNQGGFNQGGFGNGFNPGGGGFGGGGGGFGSGIGRGISATRNDSSGRLRSIADVSPLPGGAGVPGGRANPLLGPIGGEGEATALPLSRSVRIIANRDKNAVVVLASPNDYKMVEQAIERLDIAPLQVVIEATIAEVTLNDTLRYGLEWFFKGGSSTLTLSDAATGAVAPLAGFSYLLSASKASLVINALSAVSTVTVVGSPQLLVLDNQTARLQVGDQVPISTQSAVQTITTTAPIINSISYRDTGVILEVRPRVNNNGTVFLEINQEVSAVANTQSSALDSPTIQQRRIRSTVSVTDGQTIALGGLINNNRSRSNAGIPILRDIPYLGVLFGTTGYTTTRTELLVMLTPHVIRNAAEMQAATDEMRLRMRNIAPTDLPRR